MVQFIVDRWAVERIPTTVGPDLFRTLCPFLTKPDRRNHTDLTPKTDHRGSCPYCCADTVYFLALVGGANQITADAATRYMDLIEARGAL